MSDSESEYTMELCCPICLNKYTTSEKKNSPRMLNCGHTQCNECLINIFKTSQSCGECRTKITKNPSDLPINYSVLRIIESKDSASNNCLEYSECATLIKKIDELSKSFEEMKSAPHINNEWQIFKNQRVDEAIERLKKNKKTLKNLTAVMKKTKSISELAGSLEETKCTIEKVKQDLTLAKSRVFIDFVYEDFKKVLQDPNNYFIETKKKKYCSLDVKNKRLFVYSSKTVSKEVLESKKILMAQNVMEFQTGVFLQVESDGMTSFLEFELDEETQRAQVFKTLCLTADKTGFKNSSFYDASRLRLEGENVSFGKKPRNAQTRKLNLSRIHDRYIKKGSLVGDVDFPVFTVYLEGWPPKFSDHCFGRLVRGCSFLQTSIQNGKSVRIVESGFILDFKKKLLSEGSRDIDCIAPRLEYMDTN